MRRRRRPPVSAAGLRHQQHPGLPLAELPQRPGRCERLGVLLHGAGRVQRPGSARLCLHEPVDGAARPGQPAHRPGARPPTAACPRPPCPAISWVTGGWGACSASCGTGDAVAAGGLHWTSMVVKHADILMCRHRTSRAARGPSTASPATLPGVRRSQTPPTFTSVSSPSFHPHTRLSRPLCPSPTPAQTPDYVVLYLVTHPRPHHHTARPTSPATLARRQQRAGSYTLHRPLVGVDSLQGSYYARCLRVVRLLPPPLPRSPPRRQPLSPSRSAAPSRAGRTPALRGQGHVQHATGSAMW